MSRNPVDSVDPKFMASAHNPMESHWIVFFTSQNLAKTTGTPSYRVLPLAVAALLARPVLPPGRQGELPDFCWLFYLLHALGWNKNSQSVVNFKKALKLKFTKHPTVEASELRHSPVQVENVSYCWWKKSCTSWCSRKGKGLYRGFYTSQVVIAGFLPSTKLI